MERGRSRSRSRSRSPPRRRRSYSPRDHGYYPPHDPYRRDYYDRGYDRYDRDYDRRGYDHYGGGRDYYDRGYDRGYSRPPPRPKRYEVIKGDEVDRQTSRCLYIGNIPYSFREQDGL